MRSRSLTLLSTLLAFASAAPSVAPHAAANHQHAHHHSEKRQSADTGAKRGILYLSDADNLTPLSGKIDWSVNWATAPNTQAQLGEYIPQYWGTDDMHAKPFVQAANGMSEGGWLLGYNEPDMPQPAGPFLTPDQALAGWDTINAYKSSKQARIVTPSCSNSVQPPVNGNPQGMAWTTAFLEGAAAKGYQFDALAWHWYGGDSNSPEQDQAMIQQQLQGYVDLAKKYNIAEIWLTEMQRKNGDGECQFINWFENTFLPQNPILKRYAYNAHIGTLTNGGGLTPAGQAYVGQGGC